MAVARPDAALRVLLVDECADDRRALAEVIRARFGEATEIRAADDGAAAIEIADREPIDVAVVDYMLPDVDGLEVLRRIGERHGTVALVMLTGEGSELVAAGAMKCGAHDYLIKRDVTPASLERSLRRSLRRVRIEEQNARMVAELRRAHAELDHFVRALSHDMSANFMLLADSFRQLKRACDAEQDPRLGDAVAHVDACLEQSRRFLDDLVTLGKTGTIDMEPDDVELADVIDDVRFELATPLAERGIRLMVADDLPAVRCNRHRLRQVLSNLLRNAIRHGCDAADPVIRIGHAEPPPHADDQHAVWLAVHDNGPGLPQQYAEEVFLPGRRAPGAGAAGSGMGLAIVKKIIDHYGGRILVDPRSTSGTALVFSLPATRARQLGRGPLAGRHQRRGRHKQRGAGDRAG